MKNFLIKFCKWSFVTLIALISISFIPISDSKIIHLTEGTSYEKIAWNLNKLNKIKKNEFFNHVFLGPSLTQGGINDSLLISKDIKSLNFGVNHDGADLCCFFAYKLSEKAIVKNFWFYYGKNGPGLFHPMSPLLMNPFDYCKATGQIIPPQKIIKYISKRLYFVYKSLFLMNKSSLKFREYGFRGEKDTCIFLKSQELKLKYIEDHVKLLKFDTVYPSGLLKSEQTSILQIFWRNILLKYRGSGILAIENFKNHLIKDSKIHYLDIPIFGDAYLKPKMRACQFFKTNSLKIVKEQNWAKNQCYWFDLHHLNTSGANLFTNQLAIEVLADL